MKLSISWIFDHIDGKWEKQDIDYLIQKFNVTSAEIEGYHKVEFDLDWFALCKVISQNLQNFKILIPEWKKEIDLPVRDDSRSFFSIDAKNLFYMVKKTENKIEWATFNHFDSDKQGFIPSLDVQEKDLKGDWKKSFESKDIILEVDNKSITHRPDMWGHRGFAREIAAILNLNFFPDNKFLVNKQVFTYDKKAKSTKTNPIEIEIKDKKACRRFAGIYFSSIENRPSNPLIVSRLLKVGVRPINGIVDITNYLTLDWSQPVHAYDAQKIEGNKIIARMAKKKEKLVLLDGNELELTDQDLIIADGKKPLCLAGVMGGINSVIDSDTKSVFFESANFDAAFVRRTSFRYASRTESSMRFEKTLDPNQNIEGILRFLKLAKDFGIKLQSADEILSVGPVEEEQTIDISHEFFEKRSGLELKDHDIIVPLEKLGFKVEKRLQQLGTKGQREIVYSITIPTFRGSKDIEIAEDILEEVLRFYGFDRMKLELPKLEKKPSDLINPVFRLRKIKNFLANSSKMVEQQNYLLFDEQFLQSMNLQKQEVGAEIINPVSQNYSRLVNSLLPGLFKNIQDNYHVQDYLRFFEFGRIWCEGKKDQVIEKRKLAGIFFEKRKKVDFYECKNYLTDLFEVLGFDLSKIEFKKIDKLEKEWCAQYQSAKIIFDKKDIGILGKVDHAFLSKLDVLPESDAFFFEIDGDFLLNFVPKVKKFKGLSRYQETFFDLSLFVPLNLTTLQLEKKLQDVDKLVTKVKLIDFFEKEEWLDKRSLTFRLWLNNPEKTLEG